MPHLSEESFARSAVQADAQVRCVLPLNATSPLISFMGLFRTSSQDFALAAQLQSNEVAEAQQYEQEAQQQYQQQRTAPQAQPLNDDEALAYQLQQQEVL